MYTKIIYLDEELVKEATIEHFSVVQNVGNRQVKRTLEFYNLDAIIAEGGVSYKFKKETQFKI